MTLSQSDLLDVIKQTLWPALQAEKERLNRIDRWYRWDHDRPYTPRQATREYQQIVRRAQTPFLHLVVTAVAQLLYVDDHRRADQPESTTSWQYWQANGLDSRQIAVHRAALAYGLSYATVMPGETDHGEPIPVIRGVSPRRMITFYDDPAEDDWAHYALRAEPTKVDGVEGYAIRVYDAENVYFLQCHGNGDRMTYIEDRPHDAGVCPVVRFANMLDLEGRADGEVEPFIPIAARIDQTIADRLIVQRFSSWKVRTISGMVQPENQTATDAEAAKLQLKIEDILVADDPDTKFGTLDATGLDGFIKAKEADIQDLANVSQTPQTQMLGQIANLSAEALAAAEASLDRKVEERKHAFGESWEQALRLGSAIMGDEAGAADTSAQVRWRDMKPQSLSQAADALGKLAQQLAIPVEGLWERVPYVTQQDVEHWKLLAAQGGATEALMEALAGKVQERETLTDPGTIPTPPPVQPPA